MESKIKVRREAVIEAIKKVRDEASTQYAREMKAHPALVTKWQKLANARLEEVSSAVKAGTLPPGMRYGDALAFPPYPKAPSMPSMTSHNRDIAILSASTEEYITITSRDYGQYF